MNTSEGSSSGMDQGPSSSAKDSDAPNVDEWRRRVQDKTLAPKELIDFFKSVAPSLFLTESARNPAELGKTLFDESSARSQLIRPLEQLIWGPDPEATLSRLQEKENAPSVCGRVFKNGEPTYCCRECGMDPTCVLCVACFKQSTHRHHKYKMSTSSGGGCCDCGDPEAWKKDAYCDQHKAGLERKQEVPAQGLSEEQKEATKIVLEAVLDFATFSLEIDSNATIVDSDEDVYCTVLYNDETHVLEQVIQNLTKTIHCSSKEALDYVTRIDHEGRAMVKCSTFDVCNRLKMEVENQSVRGTVMQQKGQPLRVAILHKKAIAYQQFALQALAWLQGFLMIHEDVRGEFAKLVICPQNAQFNIRHVLLNDHRLWKTARTSWHKVLIAGMLMEYENKRQLATIFTQMYATVLQDHIRDDHDHSFSVASLSVQLFTVPTVAHHLIATESAFFQLMHTFYSECVEKYVEGTVLTFVKSPSNVNTFKRASVILFDVRYLLHICPESWTDELRKGFLHGVQLLIKLLRVMQGMDAVHRQTGSHIDYEPEWESAFNLHIKLERVISLVLEWCRTDKVVLVKVYRMVMAQVAESSFIVGQAKREAQELANHSANCLMYDVSVKFVSIHLPLTRFLAGLYLQLEAHNLNYDTVSMMHQKKASPEDIIEPVLCTQTMIAQVHAGMWRRNGYALLNQLYFYANVKCRAEMLDRDIAVLQIGASLIESNEFLIHVVNKFNLMNWVNENYEEEDTNNVGTVVNMVDELLELLIVVVGERFVVGIGCVTEEDCVRKELVQQLCIKPFSHSELSRALPDVQQQHESPVMEKVIEEIATFRKPQLNDKKGVYELKAEFFKDYNMFFYHYSKEDKSKSEEAQRKRQNSKNACCLPPKLPKLTESFSMLANLLQCDVMFQLMATVMKRACDLKAGLFSESHLQKILYLIGYGLQEEESGHYPFLTFYERAVKWKIPELLQDLLKSPRVETQTSFIHWAIEKFASLAPKPEQMVPEEMETGGESSSKQPANEEQLSAEAAELKEKKRLAAERQAKIMAQMMSAQKKFMSVHAEHFASPGGGGGNDDDEEEENMDWDAAGGAGAATGHSSIACLGTERKIQIEEDIRETCILCSDSSVVNGSASSQDLVFSCFVQKSNIVYGAKRAENFPHVSSCGHVMHANCWLEYFSNERAKENRRPHRQRSPGSFDIDKKEFLCPLCRCLGNTALPLNQSLVKIFLANGGTKERVTEPMDFGAWLEVMRSPEMFQKPLREMSLLSSDDGEKRAAFEALSPPVNRSQVSPKSELIANFVRSLQGLGLEGLQSLDLLWRACMYTIQSVEMVLRATNKPLRGNLSIRQANCLSGLIRVCGLIGTRNEEEEVKRVEFEKYSLYTTNDSLLHVNVFERLLVTLFFVPSIMYGRGRGEGAAGEMEKTVKNEEDLEDEDEDEEEKEGEQEQKKAKSEKVEGAGKSSQEAMDLSEEDDKAKESQCGMATGQMMDFYNLRLAFVLNMIKIIIVYDPTKEGAEGATEAEDPQEDVEMPTTSTGELPNLLTYYQNHNLFVGRDKERQRRAVTSREIVEEVKEKSSTFLRSSCLLFHFLTGVDLPEAFECLGGDTFELMCEYLGLSPNLESYFQCEQTLQFVTSRAMHQEIIDLRKAVQRLAATEAEGEGATATPMTAVVQAKLDTIEPALLPVRRLVDLPEDYSDLINSVSMFTCPNSKMDDSRNPTMCLVCGKVLCSQTYCCRYESAAKTAVGACTFHAMSCNNEVAPFLQIRECQVMLLGNHKGCMVLPPYLDEYGETDQGLRRGNPLTLCRERYQRLHLMWLSHSLHEEISRAIETSNTIGSTQWQLL